MASNGMARPTLPILRTSERSTYKRCPQKWWWEYREGYKAKGEQADARWFGIGVHIALAEWYGKKGVKRGRHPAEVFEDWIGSEISYAKTWLTDSFDEPAWEDARELGIAMLESYVNHYGTDPQWSMIAVEQPFKVKITKGGVPIAYFVSRWDGVFRDLEDGELKLLENKTASQIRLPYLAMDDQAGAYWAVAGPVLRNKGLLKPGQQIAGIQYNFLRKAMPDQRPQNELGEHLNKNGSVSLKQPPPRFVRPDLIERSPVEIGTQMNRIADEVTVMNAIREGIIPITKTTTKDCPGCDYWEMCQVHERGGDNWKQIARSAYVRQDPYEDQFVKSASE
jgi:hypothetical protein